MESSWIACRKRGYEFLSVGWASGASPRMGAAMLRVFVSWLGLGCVPPHGSRHEPSRPYWTFQSPVLTEAYWTLPDPARAYQTPTYPTLPGPTRPHQRSTRLYQTNHARPYQKLQQATRPYLTLRGLQTLFELTRHFQTVPYPTRPYQTLLDPTRPYPTLPEPTSHYKTLPGLLDFTIPY